jgi:hypothetical protein
MAGISRRVSARVLPAGIAIALLNEFSNVDYVPIIRLNDWRSENEKTPPDFGLRLIRWGRNREEAESATIMTVSARRVNAT